MTKQELEQENAELKEAIQNWKDHEIKLLAIFTLIMILALIL